jgi:hypothetical protein
MKLYSLVNLVLCNEDDMYEVIWFFLARFKLR